AANAATPVPERAPGPATPSATRGAVAPATAAAGAPPEGVTILTTLRQLIAAHGEPRAASFARLRIPRIGVDAPVGVDTVGDDAQMEVPFNPVEITWYDLSAFPGMGGAPGGGENAIFSAHVDYLGRVPYADGAFYRGKGVFANLDHLGPGDVIEVFYRGQMLRYQVKWRRSVNAVSGNWGEIWSAAVPVDSITLYTCGGLFDAGSRNYADRVVVRAERM
ncbi:MAG: class F sortase, partial [Chloroflexi bacterium]|nr:class F sortase [Chloroflexota bacterium]